MKRFCRMTADFLSLHCCQTINKAFSVMYTACCVFIWKEIFSTLSAARKPTTSNSFVLFVHLLSASEFSSISNDDQTIYNNHAIQQMHRIPAITVVFMSLYEPDHFLCQQMRSCYFLPDYKMIESLLIFGLFSCLLSWGHRGASSLHSSGTNWPQSHFWNGTKTTTATGIWWIFMHLLY